MDYKKKYKNLLAKAKEFEFQGYIDEECLYDMFPELREESEDERIRKALIKYYSFDKDGGSHALDNITPKQIVTWLEEQGKKTSDKIVKKARTEKQRVLLTETDGSANIDWDYHSLDDVKILLKCGLEFIRTIEANKQILTDNRFGGYSFRVPIRYDKGIKQSEQKPTWSEEDEAVLNALIRSLEGEHIYVSPHLAVKCLKSIKDRVQPKQEWSEEDEAKIVKLKSFIAQCKGFNKENRNKAFDMIDSINPRHTWKPTEEQMAALLVAVGDEKKLGSDAYKELYELYLQLKQL